MKTEPRVYEKVTQLLINKFIIRLWLKAKNSKELDEYNIEKIKKTIFSVNFDSKIIDTQLANFLIDLLPNINAIEVKDTLGTGCIIYRDWP